MVFLSRIDAKDQADWSFSRGNMAQAGTASARGAAVGAAMDRTGAAMPALGKIIFDGNERACVILHMSGLELTVQMAAAVKIGDTVSIETDSLKARKATVQRIDGRRVHLVLAAPDEAMPPVGKAATFAPRAPRFTLVEPARMRIGPHLLQVRTLDISQAGAKLDVSGARTPTLGSSPFSPGAIGLLTIQGMPEPKLGYVRWHVGGRLGFHFQAPIATDDVNCILAHPGTTSRNACLVRNRAG